MTDNELEVALVEVLSAQVDSLRRENLSLRMKNAEMLDAMKKEVNGYDAINSAIGGECDCADCWCHSSDREPRRLSDDNGWMIAVIAIFAVILLSFAGCLRTTEDTDVVGADEMYHRAAGRYSGHE